MAFKIQNYRSRKREPMSEINVTPFVDVMLVLLIIFMITAPMLTAGVSVNLPDSSANSLPDDKEPLTLSINAKGETFIQETQVETSQLVSKILAMSKNRTDTRIIVFFWHSYSGMIVPRARKQQIGEGYCHIRLRAEHSLFTIVPPQHSYLKIDI